MAASSIVAVGFGGARWLALGALIQKVVSVVLNQVSMRLVSVDALGIARTRLDLWLSAMLVGREGFRLAVVREHAAEGELASLAMVPSALCCMLACVLAAWPGGSRPFRIYCAAACIEASTEALHSLSLVKLVAAPRALSEALGALSSALAIVVLVSQLPTERHVEALALGQLAYSVGCCVGRIIGWRGATVPKPTKLPSTRLLRSAIWLCAQAALKQALTDGDKVALVLSRASASATGVYALAANYGALIARVALHPIEEASYSVFAALKRAHSDTTRLLLCLLKAAMLFGLTFATLGPAYAELAPLVLRTALAQPPRPEDEALGKALGAYCMYVPCLALNGIAEAFVHAVGDTTQLNRLVGVHALSAGFLLIAALAASHFADDDPATLVLLTASAMAIRVLLTVTFLLPIRRHVRYLLPSTSLLVAFASVKVVSTTSRRTLLVNSAASPQLSDPYVLAHLALGVGLCLWLALAARLSEQAYFRNLVDLLRDSRFPAPGVGPDASPTKKVE